MASQTNKRKAGETSTISVAKKARKSQIDEKTVDLVRKLLDNLNNNNNEKRERNIREIARMVSDSNKKANLAKLASMVKENQQRRSRRARDSYVVEDRDIRELARLVKSMGNMNIPKTVFSINLLRTHTRFGYTEYIYNVDIGSENMHTLPDFYVNLRSVFEYLINCSNYYAATNTDKARFYISNAPRTAFSTAILNVSDFSPDMFFNIFDRHMQSNAQEVINNGWHTTVSLYIFPN